MKKHYLLTIIILIALFIIVMILLKSVFMLPFMYKSNTSFDKDTNYQIKTLVINAVKDRCSLLYDIDETGIYTSDSKDIIQYDVKAKFKSPICFFNYDFMDSLYQNKDSTYHVIVKMKFPEEYFYDFVISKNGDRYFIEFFQLDI